MLRARALDLEIDGIVIELDDLACRGSALRCDLDTVRGLLGYAMN